MQCSCCRFVYDKYLLVLFCHVVTLMHIISFSVKNILSLIITVCVVLSFGYLCPLASGSQAAAAIGSVGNIISAYPDSAGGFYVLCDNNGYYTTVHLNSDGSHNTLNTSISTNTQGYTYCNGYFYFLTYKETSLENTYVTYAYITSIRCSDGYISQAVLNDVDVTDTTYLAVDSDGNYYFRDATVIRIYSEKKVLVKRITTSTMLLSLYSSEGGSFVVCGFSDSIGIISNKSLTTYSASGKLAAVCGNNIVTTDDGSVYSVTASSVSYLTSFSDASVGAAKIGSYTVGYEDGCLAAKKNGSTVSTISCNKPDIITSSADVCLCLYQNGTGIRAVLYSADSFTSSDEDNNTTVSSSSVSSSSSPSSPSSSSRSYTSSSASSYSSVSSAEKATSSSTGTATSVSFEDIADIQSSVYTLDSSKGIIRGIEPGTTIAQIKSNIDYGDCGISFTDHNGKAKTSGSIGTGAAITFSGGGESVTYTIIIRGDLTGEGNIKSNDKNSLYGYLLGSDSLTNTELLAADVTNNGTVDVKDLLALTKYLDGTYSITQ